MMMKGNDAEAEESEMQSFYNAIHAMKTPAVVCRETKELYGYATPVLDTRRLAEMLREEFGHWATGELLDDAIRIHEDKLARRAVGGF